MEGKIKFLNYAKGYGFISGDDGNDYFVHVSQTDRNTLHKQNDEVTFDVIETNKGKQAQNVRLKDSENF